MKNVHEPLRRQYDSVIESIDENNYELTAVVSTDSIDRYGDVIEQGGWDLGNFQKNPVIAWGHDYDQPPVGKAVHIWSEPGKLLMRIRFAVEQYSFAKTVFELYRGGYLRAFSVGFIPKKSQQEETKDGKIIRRYTELELLEVSAVTVPANQDALALAIKEGAVKQSDIDLLELKNLKKNTASQDLEQLIEVNRKNHDITKKYRKTFEALRKLLMVEPSGDEEATVDQTFAVIKTVLTNWCQTPHKDNSETLNITSARPAEHIDISDVVSLALQVKNNS